MTRKLRRRRTSREPLMPNAPSVHFRLDPSDQRSAACGRQKGRGRRYVARIETSRHVGDVDCAMCQRTAAYKEAKAAAMSRRPAQPTRPPAGTRVRAWGVEGNVLSDQYLASPDEVMVRWDMPGHKDHGRRTSVPLDKIQIVDGVEPNRGSARALGNRPSMDTGSFGADLEDDEIDSVGGAEGRDLDAAMSRYKTFHAKDPIRVAELSHDLPARWRVVGDALAVMYRTDKWKKDGVDEDYKHLHDKGDNQPYEELKGVRIYEPVKGGGGTSLPVSRPRAMTLLGYCLGVFVRKDSDGEIYEANPRGTYLFCSPSGDMLALYSPHSQSNGDKGFLAVMAGGNLRVLKDGIDG